MPPSNYAEIVDLYRHHYLREDTILARVLNERGTLRGIREPVLAEDRHTGITDQNHIGGLKFVRELAAKAMVTRESRVLDLGCGLGGSCRGLAHFWGCTVLGIDMTPERCRGAIHLTKLVGLQHLVTFKCGDLLRIAVPRQHFDILWGQGAWTHIREKEVLVRRWARCLKPGGRIAFEDAYIRNQPRSGLHRELLSALGRYWKVALLGLEAWREILRNQSFLIHVEEDHSPDLIIGCSELLGFARKIGKDQFPEIEKKALRIARTLAEAEMLGYFRIVAQRMN